MSDFWDTMSEGADATVGTMGEKVFVAGREMRAVIQESGGNPVAVAGGQSPGVTHTLHVSLKDGSTIADGDLVEGRMMKGRVDSKEPFGAGWIVRVGPANRWDGEVG